MTGQNLAKNILRPLPTHSEVTGGPLALKASKWNSQKLLNFFGGSPRGPLQYVLYHCSGHDFC